MISQMMAPSEGSSGNEAILLIDFDNICHGLDPSGEELVPKINRWISLAVRVIPQATFVRIRLYGGWLNEGTLTTLASMLLAGIPRDLFPVVDRSSGSDRILRGSVDLATRLVGVPQIEWGHTYQEKRGIPRLRMVERPRPDGCVAHDNCPIDLLQKMSRRTDRECHTTGCLVRNNSAFLLREQKMVDTLMSCDIIEYSRQGRHIIVMSNDLDLLPSVATAAGATRGSITHVRGTDAGLGDLYSAELSDLGVNSADVEAA
jgi:hypothetical protein